MNFLLYFLLRRLFVRMELTPDSISVSKGLIFRRRCEIPLSAVTRIEIRRTVLLRLLRGKRVEISTLSGGVWFYLSSRERLPFLPEYSGACVKAAPLQAIAGAFIDTRALSGVITFGLLLNRAGSVFGSESFSRIMSLMLGAAEGVTRILGELHIAVPRVTAFVVVFIAAAWLLVFLKKAVGMLRFRISCEGGYVTVRRGVFTLYEFRLVRNNLTGILCCDTLTTLLLRAAPLYAHDVMIFPPVSRRTAYRILSKLCGITPPEPQIRPPFSALFGHCAAPLGWLGVFTAALLLTFITEPIADDLGAVRPVERSRDKPVVHRSLRRIHAAQLAFPQRRSLRHCIPARRAALHRGNPRPEDGNADNGAEYIPAILRNVRHHAVHRREEKVPAAEYSLRRRPRRDH